LQAEASVLITLFKVSTRSS